jgi:hypothetical protein
MLRNVGGTMFALRGLPRSVIPKAELPSVVAGRALKMGDAQSSLAAVGRVPLAGVALYLVLAFGLATGVVVFLVNTGTMTGPLAGTVNLYMFTPPILTLFGRPLQRDSLAGTGLRLGRL